MTPHGEAATGKHPHRLRRLNEVWVDHGYPRFFLTICTQNRQPALANDQVHAKLIAFLSGSPARYNCWPTRFVIMPDHLHLLLYLNPESADLGAWVKALKAFVGRGLCRWQKGFFDHVIRHDESVREKWEYIRQNPVRAGLVKDPDDWKFAGELDHEHTAPREVTRPTPNEHAH